MADYTKKLYIAGTDIIDIIKSEGGGSLPNVGTAGEIGPTGDMTLYFVKGSLSNVNGTSSDVGNNVTKTIGTMNVPFFEVDAQGRVISKVNHVVKINASYYNYYSYRNYSSGD